MNRVLSSTFVLSSVLTIVILSSLQLIDAQVMTSPTYEIQSDSVNLGGGLSGSASYGLEDTVGEIATGPSDSTNYQLRAGYQQMQEVFLSMSDPDNVFLDPDLGGLTAGTSNGSTTVTIITDSPAGYQLTIVNSGTAPAMKSVSDSIADYVPVGVPDYNFTVLSGQAFFGFSPSGVHIPNRFKDNTSVCGTGANDTLLACWDGLSVSPAVIAESSLRTSNIGATTTIYFRVGVGDSAGIETGIYTATTTLTAFPL